MKPARFEYVAVATTDEALHALAGTEGARVLAGGQSLVPLMNMRLARPAVLVDVNGVADLAGCEVRNGDLVLGAMCRHRFLETDATVTKHAPLLAEAARLIGHVGIRNRGTLGGSLAHADPVAELPAVLVALGGRVTARSAGGGRVIPAAEFFTGAFTSALAEVELLTSVEVPAWRPGDGWAFSEFARRHGDFATVGVAVALRRDASGVCVAARLAGCGLGDGPVDLSAEAAFLLGDSSVSEEASAVEHAAAELGRRAAAAVANPPDDVHGSATYRRELTAVLVADAWRRAWARAEPDRGSSGRGAFDPREGGGE